VELAFSIPSTLKVRFNCGKWIVKALARRFLPSQIVDRKKVGFRVPLDLWFRGGILRDMARDLLLSRNSFVASIMDRPFISDLLEVHETGRRDEEMRIWTLLGLEIWHQVFFKGERLLQRQNTAAVAAD
jgi:asparagine synthase (glutamine-hydrolysing)